jgi:acetyl esterase
MPLDPQVEAYLELVADVPLLYTLPVEEARQAYLAGVGVTAGAADDVETVEDRRLPGPECEIPIRIYTPAGAGPGTLVFFHGGGWVVGNLETHDVVCRALARRGSCRVVAVDYRLAPEHRYPAAVVDAWAATAWSLHTATGPVAVAGDSAGGTLAAVVALRARDRGFPLALQVLFYPVTDAAMDTESYRSLADGYRLTREAMAWYWGHYLGDGNGSDPEVSPLRAPDLAGVAPAFVTTAEFDPLRDEAEAYAERLREAGVPVTLRRYDGLIHGYLTLSGVLDRTTLAYDEAAAALRDALS